MFSPIQFNYTWDKESFLEASHEAYKYEMKHSPKRFLGWLFIAMTQFGVIAAFKGAPVGLLLISTLLVGYWYFLRWPLRRMMLAKQFDSEKCYSVLVQEDAITINQEPIAWEWVQEVISLQKGFLLLAKGSFFFFPKSAFLGSDERNAFAALAKQKVQSYIKE